MGDARPPLEAHMIQLVGLDADDTLWHNEVVYHEAKEALTGILSSLADPQQTRAVLDRTEVRNVGLYGYGIKSFTFSMLETAVELAHGALNASHIEAILDLGRAMLARDVQPMAYVAETLTALAERVPLGLLTKGDLAEQTHKIEHSGWKDLFRQIHIVADKNPTVYRTFLAQAGVDPRHFLMVGNSMRSDILPVLDLGGHAAFVPHPLTWGHESAAAPIGNGRFHPLEDIRGVLPLLDRLNQGR
jgi:putative hydrolase of the HAD superfamily